MRTRYAPALAAALLALPLSADAQTPAAPAPEFRGAWIATVGNIDWPVRGAGAEAQKQHLRTILDRLRASGVNAVFFQVRSESDAMYRSDREPWSYWLTGVQGQDPGFDPLAFAVHEAHARGMELHAWMNPYQVERNLNAAYPAAANHLSRTHPEWTMVVGAKRVLNPGLPEVSRYVAGIVADVVRRYDVDGAHFDDYFYFEGMTTSQDAATYSAYRNGGGTLSLADWRRDNVNRMVALVNDSVRAARPSAKFGVSPTGIRLNSDANTRGYESYNAVFADGLAWLRAKTIDYIVPQVYWYIGKPAANYAAVVPWWNGVATERHLYIGQPGYKIGTTEDAATVPHTYRASTIGANLRFNRAYANVRGSVIYNTSSVLSATNGLADTLRAHWTPLAHPPTMPWKGDTLPPRPPIVFTYTRPASEAQAAEETVGWYAPPPAADGDTARFYGVYAGVAPVTAATVASGQARLVAVVGAGRRSASWPAASAPGPHVGVVAFDENWNGSDPAVMSVGAATTETVAALRLDAPAPNPAAAGSAVQLRFVLARTETVTLEAFDVLGRRHAVLDAGLRPAGEHALAWTAPAAPGLYVVRLRTEGGETASVRVVVR